MAPKGGNPGVEGTFDRLGNKGPAYMRPNEKPRTLGEDNPGLSLS